MTATPSNARRPSCDATSGATLADGERMRGAAAALGFGMVPILSPYRRSR